MKYGLIGKTLGHSFSKQIHGELSDYQYDYYEVQPEGLEELLRKRDIGGFNVTIPYKKDVIKYCNKLTSAAKRIGSVNTLVYGDNRSLLGHNTDYDGFLYMVNRASIDFKNAKVLILGSGGTSLTARTVAEDLAAREIIVVSRKGPISYDQLEAHYDSNIIINTTPVGMYPNNGESLIDLSHFKNCYGVLDVIYNPLSSQLILEAKALGIKCSGGLPMLVAQARSAAELFSDSTIPESKTEKVIQKLTQDKENIVLIGMPGSGKSSIGYELSKRLGRELIETDKLIEEMEEATIPEIFQKKGEAYFRNLERKAVFMAGKEGGKIISTGGGVVLFKENYGPLAQNGRIYFLERDIEKLSREGRPLSTGLDALKTMYKHRLPLYLSFCHKRIPNLATIDEASSSIIEDFMMEFS